MTTHADFPGAAAFLLGEKNEAVTLLGKMLIARGGRRFYDVGAGPEFTETDRRALIAFQRAQGWTGDDADGIPGPETWRLLVTGEGKDIPASAPRSTGSSVSSPVPGHRVTYAFGVKNARYAAGYHTGDDYACPTGTSAVAVRDGKIIKVGWGGAYGNWIQLKADNGRVYVYCHLSRQLVREGEQVKAGEVIGKTGQSGKVTGPHLHFEMSRNGSWAYGHVQKPKW